MRQEVDLAAQRDMTAEFMPFLEANLDRSFQSLYLWINYKLNENSLKDSPSALASWS